MILSFAKRFYLLILFLFLLTLHLIIGTKDSYISDSLLKMIQTESWIENHFTSEEIQYKGKKFDPNGEAFPFSLPFAYNLDGKLLGQYPISFTIVSSIFRLLHIPWEVIPLFSSVFFLLSLYILQKKLQLQTSTIIWGYLGTVIFALGFDFGETAVFFLCNSIGFIYWIEYQNNRKNKDLFLGILFFSLSVLFRLEGILFLFSIVISEAFIERKNWKEYITLPKIGLAILGFLPIIFYFLWNQQQYHHPLGLRFVLNFQESQSFLEKIIQFFSITFVGFNSIPKIGFFAYSSFLLIPIVFFLQNRNLCTPRINFLISTSTIFIILVGFTAPNDGVTINGRYQTLAIIPLLVLWDLWKKENPSKWILPFRISHSISILVSLLIFFVYAGSTSKEREAKKFYSQNSSDVWIFGNSILCGLTGTDYLQNQVLCFHPKTNRDPILHSLKKDLSVKTITYFEFVPEKNKPFEDSGASISSSDREQILQSLSQDFLESPPSLGKSGLQAIRFQRKSK
jgi:hypothetical protein